MTTAPTSLRGEFDPYATTNAILYDTLETVPELQPGLLAVETYSQMRRDSRLAAIVKGYDLQIRRASWQVEPGGCNPEVVQQVADDLGLPVAGDDTAGAARTRGVSWNDHLRAALLSLVFGHMTFELLAEVDGKRARLITLAERMPWTLSMIHADPKSGAFLGVSQEATGKVETPQIKADRLAHYTHERENTWYGTSLLRPAYAPWYLKRELMRVHSTSARRFGMGVPTVEWANGSNPTPAQISEAQRFASAARVGDQSGASLPPGASLVLRGLSGGVPDVLAYIKFLNSELATAALMQHIDLGNTESGSRSTASVFIESWHMALGAVASEIADVATRQIAARIVGWNWGDKEQVPRIVSSGIGAQRDVTAEALQMLLQAGALTAEPALESWVRREYRLPEAAPAPVAIPGVALPGQPGAVAPDGTPMPATAASTDDGLIAAALAAAQARNWGALNESVDQMATREAAAPAPTDLPPHWAEVADDEGQDWKVDAAMARGADIPSAVSSVFGNDDPNATARAYDIWTADQQVAPGGSAPLTLEDFTALVAAAPRPALTLDIDNRIVALAVRLGRFSALLAQAVTLCPYPAADAESTALRRVWLSSYLRIRPPAAVPAEAPDAAKTAPPAGTPPTRKVTAAAGHPSKCATAKLGSVCHCECGGVRHGWLGSMPSGIKTPQTGAPDPGNSTAPAALGTNKTQGDLTGVNGNKVPQSNPALDALGGLKAPAGLSGEKAPAPAPAAQPAPATGAPAPQESSAPDATGPLTGAEALASAPHSLVRDTGLTADESSALRAYRSVGYGGVNARLRAGTTDVNDRADESRQAMIDSIDSAMDDSELPGDVETYRGVFAEDGMFGDRFDSDLTGLEWREAAYVSTTTDLNVARGFSDDGDGAVIMHMRVPAGTHGVELSAAGDGGTVTSEAELLLERGLTMRVTADRGVDEDGIRHLDIEVAPSDRTTEEDRAEADVGEATPGGGLPAADPGGAEGRTDPEVPADGVTPAPAADERSYDERADDALTEVDARTSPPLSRIREGDRALTDDERDVVEEYMGVGFAPINHMLRGGDPSALERWDRRDRGFDLTPTVVDGWTGTLDSLMSESLIPEPIVTWRGMRNGDTLFGPAFDGDLTGVEWSDAAYSSTSTEQSEADAFAHDELGNAVPGSTVMHVLVPAGTGALELSDHNYESEVLLARGLRFRVATDWGHNPDTGVRFLDIEVIPDGG